MRGWVHFGISEAWLRLPSALFGIASIPLIYVVGRNLTASHRRAAAALLTFSPTARRILAGSAQLHAGDSSGAAVDVCSSSGRSRADGRRDWVLWTILGSRRFTRTTSQRWFWSRRWLAGVRKGRRYPGVRRCWAERLSFCRRAAGVYVHLSRVAGKLALPVDAAAHAERTLAPGDVLRRKRREDRCVFAAVGGGLGWQFCAAARSAQPRRILARNVDHALGRRAGRSFMAAVSLLLSYVLFSAT